MDLVDLQVFKSVVDEGGIISQAQYSGLVAAVIGSAVVPTLIANAFYLPRHFLNNSANGIEAETSTPSGVAKPS